MNDDKELHDALLEWYQQSDGITVGVPSELAIALINRLKGNEVKSIYIAGPQVFMPDAVLWYENVRLACEMQGLKALTPMGDGTRTMRDIFYANLQMLNECEAVLANVDPFRGGEPDSGTAWEIGYASARGKRIFLWCRDTRTVALRHAGLAKPGELIEGFDLPVNLMLAGDAAAIYSGVTIDEAIASMAKVL